MSRGERIIANKGTPKQQEATNQGKKGEENEKVEISWGRISVPGLPAEGFCG